MTDSNDRLDRNETPQEPDQGQLDLLTDRLAKIEAIVEANTRAIEEWFRQSESRCAESKEAAMPSRLIDAVMTETLAIFASMQQEWQESKERRDRLMSGHVNEQLSGYMNEQQEANQRFEQMMAAGVANHQAFLQETQEMLAEIHRPSQRAEE